MNRPSKEAQVREARLRRLAESIDALDDKDAVSVRRSREISVLRHGAAEGLYGICADFAGAINRLLARTEIVVDPPEFSEAVFREEISNMIQINARGRILQVEFKATGELISTEDFRIPYTLEGVVRAFNQELLDKNLIEEQLIFFTIEKGRSMWRFFDPRTYRSGPFDQEYLVSLMEQLV